MSNTKKNLLNENTIRRFMKLAEIDTLSDGFVTTLSEMYGVTTEEEDIVEDMPGAYARDDEEGGEPLDLPVDEPVEPGAEAEMEMCPEMEPEAPAEGAVALSDAVAQLMSVISDMTGVEIDVDGDKEEGEPADLDMGPEEEPVDLDVAPEEEEEIPGVELEEDFDQEHIVNEITRRVSARLRKESRADDVSNQLAERIIQRLKKR